MPETCCHPANLDLTPEARDEQLAAMARALGNPARVRLLRYIASQDECISGELVDYIGLAQSTVSEHLRILKEAGLVVAEPRPPRTCFKANRDALDRFRDLLNAL
ncbi:DNA-binding transcriptional ArsR family regulator [Natronospira proteinivora]|uniref:DNA-binding transcriptional ArsR family regulator n=1 Tax=Natronospira proteinivora TaxID=1807133 RepID=A0ABT1GAY5_9GAMM|nr:winged helix-turn-helix domain-containing protein [Natronospira proteinivora]MCP1727418.1 DNA-binding transcriptional ArsR family regulator [Natronospira proteinivora]